MPSQIASGPVLSPGPQYSATRAQSPLPPQSPTPTTLPPLGSPRHSSLSGARPLPGARLHAREDSLQFFKALLGMAGAGALGGPGRLGGEI